MSKCKYGGISVLGMAYGVTEHSTIPGGNVLLLHVGQKIRRKCISRNTMTHV